MRISDWSSDVCSSDLLETEAVAFARLVNREQAAVDRGHDLGLAADDPAGGVGRRQRIQRQRFSKRTDDLGWADFLILDHNHSIKSSTGGIGSTDSGWSISKGFNKIGRASLEKEWLSTCRSRGWPDI